MKETDANKELRALTAEEVDAVTGGMNPFDQFGVCRYTGANDWDTWIGQNFNFYLT
jgi:hypothetical protein